VLLILIQLSQNITILIGDQTAFAKGCVNLERSEAGVPFTPIVDKQEEYPPQFFHRYK
jgi:hypothetical protein